MGLRTDRRSTASTSTSAQALSNRESLDSTSWAAPDRIKDLDVPLRVLVADQQPRLPGDVDTEKLTAAWQAGQRRLAALSSKSNLVTAAGADDLIWQWRLDLVLMVTDALAP